VSTPTQDPKKYPFNENKVEHDIKITNLYAANKKKISILVFDTDPDIQYL